MKLKIHEITDKDPGWNNGYDPQVRLAKDLIAKGGEWQDVNRLIVLFMPSSAIYGYVINDDNRDEVAAGTRRLKSVVNGYAKRNADVKEWAASSVKMGKSQFGSKDVTYVMVDNSGDTLIRFYEYDPNDEEHLLELTLYKP